MNSTTKGALGYALVTAAVVSPLVAHVTIGPATIALEETTFAAVAKQLGEAPIVRAGDAGGGRAQTCYATSGPRPTVYYLESGEMGGGERIMQVDAVSAGTATAAEDSIIATRCHTLAPGTTAAKTDRGIMLDQSRADVERRLQVVGRDSAGVTLYSKSEEHGTSASYDISSWVRVRYIAGRVAAFSAGVVSSR
ncbi:MAG: hypothetical protein ABJE10_01090 [bacterium]